MRITKPQHLTLRIILLLGDKSLRELSSHIILYLHISLLYTVLYNIHRMSLYSHSKELIIEGVLIFKCFVQCIETGSLTSVLLVIANSYE